MVGLVSNNYDFSATDMNSFDADTANFGADLSFAADELEYVSGAEGTGPTVVVDGTRKPRGTHWGGIPAAPMPIESAALNGENPWGLAEIVYELAFGVDEQVNEIIEGGGTVIVTAQRITSGRYAGGVATVIEKDGVRFWAINRDGHSDYDVLLMRTADGGFMKFVPKVFGNGGFEPALNPGGLPGS
jgi:hypothetical protein